MFFTGIDHVAHYFRPLVLPDFDIINKTRQQVNHFTAGNSFFYLRIVKQVSRKQLIGVIYFFRIAAYLPDVAFVIDKVFRELSGNYSVGAKDGLHVVIYLW